MSRTSVAWGLFAVFGLGLALGVAIAASRLADQHVALSSEPITAGQYEQPSYTPPGASRAPSPAPAQPSGGYTAPQPQHEVEREVEREGGDD
jgi:hypothetical protein